MDRLTDGQMDGRTPDRFIDPDPHARSVKKRIKLSSHQDCSLTEFSAKILSTLDTYRQALSNLTRSSYVSQDHLSVPKFY